MTTHHPVTNPTHYVNGLLPGLECLDVTEHLDGLRFNIVKYLWRYEQKNGTEDLRKAQFYLHRLQRNHDLLRGEVPEPILHEAINVLNDQLSKQTVSNRKYHVLEALSLMLGSHPNETYQPASLRFAVADRHITQSIASTM